jgi:hypothetical protein
MAFKAQSHLFYKPSQCQHCTLWPIHWWTKARGHVHAWEWPIILRLCVDAAALPGSRSGHRASCPAPEGHRIHKLLRNGSKITKSIGNSYSSFTLFWQFSVLWKHLFGVYACFDSFMHSGKLFGFYACFDSFLYSACALLSDFVL